LSSAPPQILQRWIVPRASVPVGAQVQELDFSGGQLFALGGDEVQAIDVAPPEISAGGVFVRHVDVAIPAHLTLRAKTRGMQLRQFRALLRADALSRCFIKAPP